MQIKCDHCGKRIQAEEEQCPHCGSFILDRNNAPDFRYASGQEPQFPQSNSWGRERHGQPMEQDAFPQGLDDAQVVHESGDIPFTEYPAYGDGPMYPGMPGYPVGAPGQTPQQTMDQARRRTQRARIVGGFVTLLALLILLWLSNAISEVEDWDELFEYPDFSTSEADYGGYTVAEL